MMSGAPQQAIIAVMTPGKEEEQRRRKIVE